MRCFYHQDADAVATCKNCGRGLCAGCAVDVGNGLACPSRCEEEVRALNRVIARNKTAYQKTSGAYVFSISSPFNGLTQPEVLREEEWMIRTTDFRGIC